jgi:hypothetical protein
VIKIFKTLYIDFFSHADHKTKHLIRIKRGAHPAAAPGKWGQTSSVNWQPGQGWAL